MSSEQTIQFIIERLKDHDMKFDKHEIKFEKHDSALTNLLVMIGALKVKTGMIVGVFSAIGGALTAIIMKFVLKM